MRDGGNMAKVVQMNLKIPAALRMVIRVEAKAKGMKINALIERILTQAFIAEGSTK